MINPCAIQAFDKDTSLLLRQRPRRNEQPDVTREQVRFRFQLRDKYLNDLLNILKFWVFKVFTLNLVVPSMVLVVWDGLYVVILIAFARGSVEPETRYFSH